MEHGTADKRAHAADGEPFFITTPIYYVNGEPHIGTAYTTIAADAMARAMRMQGRDVRFLTGLDEHGQKVAEAAAAHGMTPQEWCDAQVGQFTDLWKTLGISNDDFIRTTQARHERGVQQFMQRLKDAGYLYKAAYEGWYCIHEETYYTNSETVEIDGQKCCPDCRRPLRYEKNGEENWFFKLSEFGDALLALYDEHPDFVNPPIRRNEVRAFVAAGLHDLSVSRSSFDWGVPLPFDPDHVAYVWVDALINYLTALGYGSDDASDLDRFWPADFHFVGKDIIRFHCVIWPAMLMAAGMPLPRRVFAHGFLMAADGSKMSKSKGNALYPAELVGRYGVDAYRYYFCSDVKFGADGNIGHARMTEVYNTDLANTYGNLFSRVSNMVGKYCGGRVPQAPDDAEVGEDARADAAGASAEDAAGDAGAGEFENPLRPIADGLYPRWRAAFEDVDFAAATGAVMELLHRANLYVETSAPWNLAKDPARTDELAAVLYNALEACRISALYLAPFMPATSAELLSRMGLPAPQECRDIEAACAWGGLPCGNEVVKGDALFPRLQKLDAQAAGADAAAGSTGAGKAAGAADPGDAGAASGAAGSSGAVNIGGANGVGAASGAAGADAAAGA